MKMVPAAEIDKTITNLLNRDFGADIRTVNLDGRKFSVSFKNNQPIIVCEWTIMPPNEYGDEPTVNGSRLWWVRIWETGQEVTTEHARVMTAAANSAVPVVEKEEPVVETTEQFGHFKMAEL